MLVLSREIGSSIIFGDGTITVKVLSISHGNIVNLGIDAPKKLSVHREEVFNLIKASPSSDANPRRIIQDDPNICYNK